MRLDAGALGYVPFVGVRSTDGTLELLHEPVTEDGLVRKAVGALAPKPPGQGGLTEWGVRPVEMIATRKGSAQHPTRRWSSQCGRGGRSTPS